VITVTDDDQAGTLTVNIKAGSSQVTSDVFAVPRQEIADTSRWKVTDASGRTLPNATQSRKRRSADPREPGAWILANGHRAEGGGEAGDDALSVTISLESPFYFNFMVVYRTIPCH
jgi:hypothetical protein